MTPAFAFQLGPLGWAPSLLALAALLLLALIVLQTSARAWRRLGGEHPSRRWGVGALNLVALLAVAALLAPPTLDRPIDASVTLLTEGAVADAGASLTGEAYTLDATAIGSNHRLQGLQSAGQLALRRPDLGSLNVLGHGLAPEDWDALPADLEVVFDPPPLDGLVRPRWSRVLAAGEALVVQGALRLAEAGTPGPERRAEVRLVDPAGVAVASTTARNGDAFTLQDTPRAPGALTYRLQLLEGDAVLADEPVTTYVRDGAGARLLVLQSAPSFETRHLAAWAADRGQSLVVRSQVSRDRDLVQGINLPEAADTDLTPALLEATDLAVVDGRRWASLEPGPRRQLLDAVRDGLGLLLLADDELAAWLDDPEHAAQAGVHLEAAARPDPVWLTWPGVTPEHPLPLAPFRLVPSTAQALTQDEGGEWLETWQPLNSGRIAVSLLRERHRWATAGARSDFSRYWTRLSQEIARPPIEPRWAAPGVSGLARAGERLLLCAELPGVPAGAVEIVDATSLALRFMPMTAQAPDAVRLLPHDRGVPQACGHAWPSAPGWHRLELLGADTAVLDRIDLRVFTPGEWQAAEFDRRQAATRARMTRQPAPADARRVAQALSPWWAWGVLLLAGGALWAERRLFDLA